MNEEGRNEGANETRKNKGTNEERKERKGGFNDGWGTVFSIATIILKFFWILKSLPFILKEERAQCSILPSGGRKQRRVK